MYQSCRLLRTASVCLAALSLNAAGNATGPLPTGPELSPLSFDRSEGFRMTLDGLPGSYGIQFSDDLSDWSPFDEISILAEPVELPDSDSLNAPKRFYQVHEVSVFPEYHTLLSTWALRAKPGVSSFLMGFTRSDSLFLDADGGHVVVWGNAEASSATVIHSDGTVEVTGNHGAEAGRFSTSATFSNGGLTVHVLEDIDSDDTYFAWDLPMHPLGQAEGDLAGMLSGTALRQAEFDAGAGKGIEFVQAFMARKSVDAGIADLIGEWGIVRLEIEGDTEGKLYTILSAPVTISDEDGGTFSVQGIEIETEMKHFFDGSDPERRYFEPTEIDFDFPIHISPDGEVLVSIEGFGRPGQDSQNLAGFMSPAGDFLVLAEGWPEIHQTRIGEVPEGAGDGFAAHQLFLGVRRDLNPDLAGKEYRLEGQSFWVSRWDFEMLPSGPDGIAGGLSFDQNGEATLTLEDLMVRIPFYDGDQGGIIVETEDPDEIPLSYTVAPDGRLNFDMSDLTDPGDEAFFTGFAQEGGRVLILGLGFAGENDEGGDQGQISMWVATCVNCD